MKKGFLITLLITAFIITGCQSKGSLANGQAASKAQNSISTSDIPVKSTASTPNTTTGSTKDNVTTANSSSSKDSIGVPSIVTPIETVQDKAKLDTAINSIDSSLSTLDEVKDINLNSIK